MPYLTVFVGLEDPSVLHPWIDEDFTEHATSTDGLAPVFHGLSFSTMWAEPALEVAAALGVSGAHQATVLVYDGVPWKRGDRVGTGVCLGPFEYRGSAPSQAQVDTWTVRAGQLECGDLRAAIIAGVEDVVAGSIREVRIGRAFDLAVRVARGVEDGPTTFPADVQRELADRLDSQGTEQHQGFATVLAGSNRLWMVGGVVVAVSAAAEGTSRKPTDMCWIVEPSVSTPWSGVVQVPGDTLMVDAEKVAEWRAMVQTLRTAWRDGVDWDEIAVLFPTRERAVALQAEGLDEPEVMGWYRHPTGVYEP